MQHSQANGQINKYNANAVDLGVIPYEEVGNGSLGELELRLFSERFWQYDYRLDEESGGCLVYFTEVNGMFKSYYDSPKELNLAAFLESFPKYEVLYEAIGESEGDVDKKQEFDYAFELLKDKHGSNIGGSEFYIQKIKKTDVDHALKKYAGIKTDDLSNYAMKDVVYGEEYDSYYQSGGSVSGGYFVAESGTRDGDIYTLYGNQNAYGEQGEKDIKVKLVLRREGDEYRILSHNIYDGR